MWAATEARALGRGGQTLLAKVTGMSRSTLHRGLQELAHGVDDGDALGGRVRLLGGGRKALTYHQPRLPQALEALGEPSSRGDPQSPLRWTCKSVRHLASELTAQGYRIGRQKVADLLHELGYSLQANCKSPSEKFKRDYPVSASSSGEMPSARTPTHSGGDFQSPWPTDDTD